MRSGCRTRNRDARARARGAVTSTWIVCAAVALCTAAVGLPVQLRAAATPATAVAGKSIEERIAELEALVRELRVELETLKTVSPGGGPTSGTQAALDELRKRIDALAQEIERLRIGEAAAPPSGAQAVGGFGPAAAKVYGVKRGVSIGGYGDMLYQNVDARADDGQPSGAIDTADLERAVLYFGYKWTDHLLFNSEIEYAHAVVAPDAPGEVEVEFAYLDYHPSRRVGLRAGLLLVPMGFLSELHEPPIFYGARRPDVETFILPSTWRENGLGVYGETGPVSYRVYLVTSLDASGFSSGEWAREARQEGAEAKARNWALTARVDITPVPGLLLGAAGFGGGTGQGNPAIGDARVTLWDAHAEWNARGWHLRSLYARGELNDAGAVSLEVDPLLGIDPGRGTAIGSRVVGWYGELAWNVLSRLHTGRGELSPFVRYEALDTQERVARPFTRDPGNDRSVRTYGLHYRPIPNVAIKLDYQDYRNRAGSGVDQFNLAIGYLF